MDHNGLAIHMTTPTTYSEEEDEGILFFRMIRNNRDFHGTNLDKFRPSIEKDRRGS